MRSLSCAALLLSITLPLFGFVPQSSVGYFATGERVYTFGVD